MSLSLIISIVPNISLLLAISIIYAVIPSKDIFFKGKKSIYIGVLIGLTGIAIMSWPYPVSKGIILDVRSILIGITGMFLGPAPTVIASVMTSLFRIFEGGNGVLIGILSIIASAVTGLFWHRFRFEKALKRECNRFLELYITGLMIHILMTAFMLLLPWDSALFMLKNVSLLLLAVYPFIMVLLGLLIFHQIDRTTLLLQLEESEERLRVTLKSVGDGVISTDNRGIVTFINLAAEEITGCTGAIGKSVNSVMKLVNEATMEPVSADPVKTVLETGRVVEFSNHTVLVCADGTEKDIEDCASPIKDDKGNLAGVVFIIRDVTEARKKQQQIKYLGYHDSLTGLYNRSFFDEELKRLDTERNLPISIIIGDVNGLKLTNDAFGHAVGDQLLKDMADEIKKACRKEDIVARWGGDEFIVLLPRTDEKTAENICARIKENCASVKMSDVNFSISLGYETKTSMAQITSDVVKSAENFMYRKKSVESTGTRGRIIYTILLTLYEKNPREEMHSRRVSEICGSIGKAMGKSQREVSELQLIGLMHDIGKIAISDKILNKKGPLTPKEWSEMRRHPEIGYRILGSSNDMAYIADYVLKHHERLDGKGYPNGISGKEIPLESRILMIADSFDAMTTERPYRGKLSDEKAVQRLRDNSGTQFDSEIVEIFIGRVLNSRTMNLQFIEISEDGDRRLQIFEIPDEP